MENNNKKKKTNKQNKNKSKAVAKITDTVSYIHDCAKVKPSTLGSALGSREDR